MGSGLVQELSEGFLEGIAYWLRPEGQAVLVSGCHAQTPHKNNFLAAVLISIHSLRV